jgi:hypothetical protein
MVGAMMMMPFICSLYSNPANPAASGTSLEAAETAVCLFAH